MRVLAVGAQDFAAADVAAVDDPKDLLDRIVLVALVGIVDPPRPEAQAGHRRVPRRRHPRPDDHRRPRRHRRGHRRDLGIPGQAVTGTDLDQVPYDDELGRRLDEIGVIARVSPEHKIRIVRALQARGDVVAMTGDGVNDAPALRKADIGVAMGLTGTEVTKEAATMILTDDNFATIVRAVREGRGIYDNIVKFTRFQLSTALGFVLTFLIASMTGIAGGAPFTALQILFVNLVMDGPPAMSLGVDPVSPDAMRRPPRPARERILTRPRLLRILLASAVMAAGTLAVLASAPGPEPQLGVATVAGTMAFVTFVFFQAFNLLNVRDDTRSVFSRETLQQPHRVRRHGRRRRAPRPHRPGRRPARLLHHHRPHLRSVAGLRRDRLRHPVGRRAGQDRATRPRPQSSVKPASRPGEDSCGHAVDPAEGTQ